jgi:hypothetical protein
MTPLPSIWPHLLKTPPPPKISTPGTKLLAMNLWRSHSNYVHTIAMASWASFYIPVKHFKFTCTSLRANSLPNTCFVQTLTQRLRLEKHWLRVGSLTWASHSPLLTLHWVCTEHTSTHTMGICFSAKKKKKKISFYLLPKPAINCLMLMTIALFVLVSFSFQLAH